MGMIDRYKKAGGFVQLLNLIETCGPQKQEKFLQIIREEAPAWEEALRAKMINITRVFSWNDVTLADIVSRIQPLTFAIALHGLKPEQMEQAMKALTFSQKRQIGELKDSSKPTPGEISASFEKIIVEVREMTSKGFLKFEKFDPDLVLEEDIEDKLSKGIYRPGRVSSSHATSGEALVFNIETGKGAGASSEETDMLRRKVLNLTRELEHTNRENKSLQDKLAQIRKIA